MPTNILQSVPAGERSASRSPAASTPARAIHWMRAKGAIPYAYTANLGQPDEPDYDEIPARALALRRRKGAAGRLPRRNSSPKGIAALQSGAFHISHRRRNYFNTTPIGRAVTGTMLVIAMKEDEVHIWGDGSTYKGNDIERFYRYGLLANPALRIYKPWLDQTFIDELGGRKEMSEYMQSPRLQLQDERRRKPTRPIPISGARRTKRRIWSILDKGVTIVEPIMGVAFWRAEVTIKPEEMTVRFEEGRPVALNGVTFDDPVELVLEANAHRRPPRPRHVATRSRTASSKPRAAAFTKRPGMALLFIAYERLRDRHPQRGHDRAVPYQRHAAGPAAVPGPLVRSAGA